MIPFCLLFVIFVFVYFFTGRFGIPFCSIFVVFIFVYFFYASSERKKKYIESDGDDDSEDYKPVKKAVSRSNVTTARSKRASSPSEMVIRSNGTVRRSSGRNAETDRSAVATKQERSRDRSSTRDRSAIRVDQSAKASTEKSQKNVEYKEVGYPFYCLRVHDFRLCHFSNYQRVIVKKNMDYKRKTFLLFTN